ncbi:MAG: DUF1217 domain-containing protein [Acetobacteraceae bacterium]|nr:DUF1217 domain-containing protein [Acetobacteraceae bacterium]
MSSSITSLLSAAMGSSSSSITTLMLEEATGGTVSGITENPVTALSNAEQDETQEITATSQEPQVARAIQAFTTAVQNATTPQQLLSNPQALQVLLTANGLGDQTSYTALATQTLLSNINDPNSLVNKLSDTRWQSVVQTYDFANKGLSVIQNPQVIQTIANGYAEVTWMNSLDATTPGLSDALTFRQEASSITSVDQILGDPIMRTVVTTALGVPEQIAFQDLPAQEQAITSRLDISKFQDPNFVEQFTQRYLIAAAQAASSSSSSTSSSSLEALAVRAQGLIA